MQCFNKKSVGAKFTEVDMLTLTLLAVPAAAAIANAKRYNTEFRQELNSRKVLDLCDVLPQERDLTEVPRLICSTARELLSADWVSLYFLDPATGVLQTDPVVVRPRIEISTLLLLPLCFTFQGSPPGRVCKGLCVP